MAEILIKVGTVAVEPAYQDGDILCAFTDDHIKCKHAEIICHPKDAARSNGLITASSLTEDFLSNLRQFKFERVSATEIKRITLSDMSEEIISGTPNANGEHMDVAEFVRRRKANGRNPIFGTDGAEYWFGGNTSITAAKLSTIWTQIEAKTSNLEANFTRWSLTDTELKHFIVLPTESFTADKAEAMTAPLIDETDPEHPVILKKRNQGVTIDKLDRISTDTIKKFKDPDIIMDMRKFADWDTATEVKVKA